MPWEPFPGVGGGAHIGRLKYAPASVVTTIAATGPIITAFWGASPRRTAPDRDSGGIVLISAVACC